MNNSYHRTRRPARKWIQLSRSAARLFLICACCLCFGPASSLAQDSTVAGSGDDTSGESSEANADSRSPDTTEEKSGNEAASQAERESDEPTLAITGATILTIAPTGTVEDGVVLIGNQRIVEVGGPSLKVPEGIEVIDATGCILTPGLIDASSRLWLTNAAAGTSANDASLNVLDGIDPFDDQWHEVIRHGVTSVYVQPNSSGTLSGYGAVLSVAPAASDSGLEIGPEVLKEFAALQAAIGPGASNNKARSQQLGRITKAFKAAADYQAKWDKYNEYLDSKKKEKSQSKTKSQDEGKNESKGKPSDDSDVDPSKTGQAKPNGDPGNGNRPVRGRPSRGRGGGPATGSSDEDKDEETKAEPNESQSKSDTKDKSDEEKDGKPPKKPEYDASKERLAKVVSGGIPLRLEIHSPDDVFYVQKLIKEYPELQIVFSGLSELGSASNSIVELSSPVVLGPWLNLNGSATQDETISHWDHDFAEYPGALVVGSSANEPRGSRLLRAQIGRAIAAGISREQALESVTLNAARMLAIDDQLGSIEAGKRADLVAFAGDPSDFSKPVRFVISAGKLVYENFEEVSGKQVVKQDAEWSVQNVGPECHAALLELARLGDQPFSVSATQVLMPDGSVEAGTLYVDPADGTLRYLSGSGGSEDTVELGDLWLTPGLFSSHANLGLQSLLDTRLSDATDVVAADVVAAEFKRQQRLVETGVLQVLLSPGASNTLAGTASLVRIGASGPIENREAAIEFSFTSSARTPDRYPSSLAGQIQMVKESLAGQLLDTRLYLPVSVQRRLDKLRVKRLTAAASGKSLVVFQVSADSEIQAALDLIEMHSLKAAIVGARQLKPFLSRIASLDVAVIAEPVTDSTYHWYFDDLASAASSGIEICFAGETAEQLRLTAAMAIAAGVPERQVLTSLCYGPNSLRTEDYTKGDFVVWSACPTDLRGRPIAVFVDGQTKFLGESTEEARH